VKVAGLEVGDAIAVGGGDICRSVSARTADGERVFVKTLPEAPAGFFEAEARGLDRIRVDGGPPVPGVRAVDAGGLVLDWVEPGRPGRDAALDFGTRLAGLHRTTSERFGAAAPGFVATVPVDNTPTHRWSEFYAERRLLPALAAARARGAIDNADAHAVEAAIGRLDDLAGVPEPPARVHGDLWAGNLLWAGDGRVWLVDAAAAHDGHRETDLAMLALFNAPYLAEIMAVYDAAYPLAPGWQRRVPLHQIHPLLIHAILFGGGYGARAGDAARRAVAA
jgi:fructosamine-3-kinase